MQPDRLKDRLKEELTAAENPTDAARTMAETALATPS